MGVLDWLKERAKDAIDVVDTVVPYVMHPIDSAQRERDLNALRTAKKVRGYRWAVSNMVEGAVNSAPGRTVIKPLTNLAVPKIADYFTGIPADKVEKYIYPHLSPNGESLTDVGLAITKYAASAEGNELNAQDLRKYLLRQLGKTIEKSDNPGKVFSDLYSALTDENGLIPESVKNSPALGGLAEMLQGAIPAEFKDSIPEKEALGIAKNSLMQLVSTEAGKKAAIAALGELETRDDFKKIAQETGLNKLGYNAVRNGFLSYMRDNNKDIESILGGYLQQVNPLGLSEDVTKNLATALSSPRSVDLLEKIIPENLTLGETDAKDISTLLRENLLSTLKTNGKDFENALTQVSPELPRQLIHAALTSQANIAPAYADSLSRFFAGGDRLTKALEVLGETKVEDGKVQNADQLAARLAEKFDSNDDREAMAKALTPSMRAYLGIKETEVKENGENGLAPISPLAIVTSHFLTSKNNDDLMNRPIRGANGEEYKNISQYLASEEMRGEMRHLQGNEAFLKRLQETRPDQWGSLLTGMIPDEKTFQAFKQTLTVEPGRAFQPKERGGFLPSISDIQQAYTQADPNAPANDTKENGVLSFFGKMASSVATNSSLVADGLSISKALANGEALVTTYPEALTRQPGTNSATAQKEQQEEEKESQPTAKTKQPAEKNGGLSAKLSKAVPQQQPTDTQTPGLNGRLAAQGQTVTAPTQTAPTKPKDNVFAARAAAKRRSNAA